MWVGVGNLQLGVISQRRPCNFWKMFALAPKLFSDLLATLPNILLPRIGCFTQAVEGPDRINLLYL
jgi:hypothetical protein